MAGPALHGPFFEPSLASLRKAATFVFKLPPNSTSEEFVQTVIAELRRAPPDEEALVNLLGYEEMDWVLQERRRAPIR